MADPWVKVWWDWYTSRSHASVGGNALYAGTLLMQFGKSSPSDDPETHWVLHPDHKPVTNSDLSRIGQMRVSVISKGLSRLVEVGTLRVRDDGAYGFDRANWSKYQPMSSTERTRRQRQRDADGTRVGRGGDEIPSRDMPEARIQRPEPSRDGGGNSVQRCAAQTPPPPPLLVDESDRELPEVRGIGITRPEPAGAVTSADVAIQLLDIERRKFAAELPPEQRKRLRPFTGDGRTSTGVQNALDEYGWDVVIEVCRHSWDECSSGVLSPVLLACMFHGAGFGAHLQKAEEGRRKASERARLFAPEPEREDGPEPDIADIEAAAARFALKVQA